MLVHSRIEFLDQMLHEPEVYLRRPKKKRMQNWKVYQFVFLPKDLMMNTIATMNADCD